MAKIKARNTPRGTIFVTAGIKYRLLAFVDVRPEPYFILENLSNGYVFESLIDPDMELDYIP